MRAHAGKIRLHQGSDGEDLWQIIQKIVSDAATYNNAKKNAGYGFQGDPLRPISGKYYGYLIRAGLD